MPSEMTYTAKLAIKGNTYAVKVPFEVRDALGIEMGDWLEVTVRRKDD